MLLWALLCAVQAAVTTIRSASWVQWEGLTRDVSYTGEQHPGFRLLSCMTRINASTSILTAGVGDRSYSDVWALRVSGRYLVEWEWVAGSSLNEFTGNYTTLGAVCPGKGGCALKHRNGHVCFKHPSQDKVYFGAGTGATLHSDMWAYDAVENTLQWVSGGSIGNEASSASDIGARRFSCAIATPTAAYVYGGTGFPPSGGARDLADLYAFDFSTETWSFVAGDSTSSNPAPSTVDPSHAGGRYGHQCWFDSLDQVMYIAGGTTQRDMYGYNITSNNFFYVNATYQYPNGTAFPLPFANEQNRFAASWTVEVSPTRQLHFSFGGQVLVNIVNDFSSDITWYFDPMTKVWVFYDGSHDETRPVSSGMSAGLSGEMLDSNHPGHRFRATVSADRSGSVLFYSSIRFSKQNDLWSLHPCLSDSAPESDTASGWPLNCVLCDLQRTVSIKDLENARCTPPPTLAPSAAPSAAPSESPSATPSAAPSAAPSASPSFTCVPGTYFNEETVSANTCELCPTGRWSDVVGSGTVNLCVACESGRYGPWQGASSRSGCLSCPAGRYSTVLGIDTIDECANCTVGKFGTQSAANQEALCSNCPMGRYNDESGAGECRGCPPGRFGNTTGSEHVSSCTVCPPGTFSSASGVTTCTDCPSGTFSIVEGAATADTCQVCPASASCNSGSSVWFIKPGFFRDPSDPFQITPCTPPEACLDTGFSETTTCASGYTGPQCGSCVAFEYYRSGQGCAKCGSQAIKWFLLVLVVFAGLSILYFIINSKGDLMTKFGIRSIITSVQIIAIYPKISQDWSPEMLSFFDALSITNLNIELFSPECSVPLDYFSKWIALQLLPIILGVSLCIVHVVVGRMRKEPVSPYAVAGAAFYLMVTIYTYLVSNALEPFNCLQQGDGSYIMAFNPDQRCFEGAWNDYEPYFVLAAIFYCALFPLMIFCVFLYYRSPASRESKVFQHIFGILSRPFKQAFFYWEFVFTMEKVAVVASADILSAQLNSQPIKVFIIIVLIFIFFSIGSAYRPYRIESRNTTEAMWAIVRLVILVSATVFASDAVTTQEKYVISALLITVFVLFLVYTVGSFMVQMKLRRDARYARFIAELQSSVRAVFGVFPESLHQEIAHHLLCLNKASLRVWVRLVAEHHRTIGEKLCPDHDAGKGVAFVMSSATERSTVPRSHKRVRAIDSRASTRVPMSDTSPARDESVISTRSEDAMLPKDNIAVVSVDRVRSVATHSSSSSSIEE